MNKVILTGRLTKDIELKYTPNGNAVGSFTIASNRRFKRDGQPEADFINCIVWQKQAENAVNMIGKGCRVSLVGRWETRTYDGSDGKRVYVSECVVEEMDFIDFADRNNGSGGDNTQSNTNSRGNQNNSGNGQEWANNNTPDISDSDLPF